jgi:hypothetical protein
VNAILNNGLDKIPLPLEAESLAKKVNACWWRCDSASVSRTKIGWISAAISLGADSGRRGWWSATAHRV